MNRWSKPVVWMLTVAFVVSVSPIASAASRWDVAYLTGIHQLRVDIEDQGGLLFRFNNRSLPPQPIEMRDPAITRIPGGWILNGTISSGSITIGLGGTQFGIGDSFSLTVSRFDTDIVLTLDNGAQSFTTVMPLYRVGDQIVGG